MVKFNHCTCSKSTVVLATIFPGEEQRQEQLANINILKFHVWILGLLIANSLEQLIRGHTSGRVFQSNISPSRQVEELVNDLAIGTFIWVYS